MSVGGVSESSGGSSTGGTDSADMTGAQTVGPNDSLADVAERMGVTPEAVMAANPQLSNPFGLTTGMTLSAPPVAATTNPAPDPIADALSMAASLASPTLSQLASSLSPSVSAMLSAATSAIATPNPEALARSLVKAGGTATQVDVDLVVNELKQAPVAALQTLVANNVSVVAARNSVTDHLTHLQGVQPRGWPPNATWDNVPGAYNPATKEVVVATRGHGTPNGPQVAKTGDGHGSYNLTLHETMHAVDHVHDPAGKQSLGQAFTMARNADIGALSAYETQPTPAGESETYAESAARHFGGDPSFAKTHPALDGYWSSNPLTTR